MIDQSKIGIENPKSQDSAKRSSQADKVIR